MSGALNIGQRQYKRWLMKELAHAVDMMDDPDSDARGQAIRLGLSDDEMGQVLDELLGEFDRRAAGKWRTR